MNYKSGTHKPNSEQYTAILEFTVVKPQHDLETKGEILFLSNFGEYCPNGSLRGYQLKELITKTEHYRPSKIIQMGKIIEL